MSAASDDSEAQERAEVADEAKQQEALAFQPRDGPRVEPIRAPFNLHAKVPARLRDNIDQEQLRKLEELLTQAVEKELFYWTDMPLELPKTVFTSDKPVQMAESFQSDTYDDRAEVSRDETGKQKRLSAEQFSQLLHTGTFSVPSQRFPGQNHVWKISPLISFGTDNIKSILYSNYSRSLSQLRIEIPARLWKGREWSVVVGFKQIGKGFYDTIHAIFGLPSMVPEYHAHDVEEAAHRQRLKSTFKDGKPQDLSMKGFPKWVDVPLKEGEKGQFKDPMDIQLSYCSNSASGFGWINNEVHATFKTVEDRWFLDRAAFIDAAKKEIDPSLSEDEAEQFVINKCVEEKVSRFYAAIEQNGRLRAGPYAQIVINFWKALRIIRLANMKYRAMLSEAGEAEYQRLLTAHPIKAALPGWLTGKVDKFAEQWAKAHEGQVEQEIVESLKREGLQQELFLFQRNEGYRKTTWNSIVDTLSKLRKPFKTFQWDRYFWSPSSWIITRRIHKKTGDIHYSDQRYSRYETTTRYFGWRFTNIFMSTFRNWNVGLLGLCWLLAKGPLSLRALLAPTPYYSLPALDSKTGHIVDDKSSLTQTLPSRLSALWNHIAQSRTKFEAEPDSGLIGKGVTRIINVVWNYVFKGLVGTSILVTVQPLLTVLYTVVCLALVLTSPAWAPLSGVLRWLCTVFVFDLDGGGGYAPFIKGFIWRVLIRGFVCIASSLISAAVLHPLFSLFLFLYGSLTATLRYLYYLPLFYLLVRPRAKIPDYDGFLARRIQGPNTAAQVFLQISPREAMIAVRAHLELQELAIWESRMRLIIGLPAKTLANLSIHRSLQAFNLNWNTSSPMFDSIHNSQYRFNTTLNRMLKDRRKKIPTFQNAYNLRQTRTSLDSTLTMAEGQITKFVVERILTQLTPAQASTWWAGRAVTEGDFTALTKEILSKCFSPSFLVPLENHESSVRLKLKDLDLDMFGEMLNGNPSDPLDVEGVEVESVLKSAKSPTVPEINPNNRYPIDTLEENVWPLRGDDRMVSWQALWNAPLQAEGHVDAEAKRTYEEERKKNYPYVEEIVSKNKA